MDKGQKLIRSNGTSAVIESVTTTRKGTLYTVQYDDGTFRRYYQQRFEQLFKVVTEQPIDVSNVVFFDFKYKVRMNYKTWLDWRAS